jgi:hypothetical protein
MSILRTLFACLVLLASGCATNLQVVYTSDPPGAALYESDRYFGTTPMTLTYAVTKEDRRIGSKRLRGTSVHWISGAAAGLSELTVYLGNGLRQAFTYQRPDGVPGYEADANYARLDEASRKAEASRRQTWPPPQPIPPNAGCTSRMVGSTIYTECK